MTVSPVPNEPTRFRVISETDGEDWLVDLDPGPDMPKCACAIEHKRTPEHWHCKHVEFVLQMQARARVIAKVPTLKP